MMSKRKHNVSRNAQKKGKKRTKIIKKKDLGGGGGEKIAGT